MNDEPHSHKKATVALVVLLLAYPGSYLFFRSQSKLEGYIVMEVKVILIPEKSFLSVPFLNRFYYPLRLVEAKITGNSTNFWGDPDALYPEVLIP